MTLINKQTTERLLGANPWDLLVSYIVAQITQKPWVPPGAFPALVGPLLLFLGSKAQAQLTERLFTTFHAFLREANYAARAGQIIDASVVTDLRQRMRR